MSDSFKPSSSVGDDFEDNELSDSDGSKAKSKTGKSTEFSDLLEASFKKKSRKLEVGDKIHGEILVLGKEEIFVSTGPAGSSTDGIVARRDLLDADGKMNHKVGDSLDLYVTQVRGSEIRLSPKASAKNLAEDIEDAYDMMIPIEGKVSEVCKGGVRVTIKGKIAFCPISQLDTVRVETGEEYIGKKLEFLITQFSEGGRNIIVSRRKLLEEQRGLSESTFGEEFKDGQIIPGKVKKLETFGAFVEIAPGIEGLLHISQLSWSRVADPSEVVKVGQKILVKILKTENKDGRLRISLSLKDAGLDPWSLVAQKYPVGAIVPGKIERREVYGLFVQLEEGITGLLPKSKAMEAPEFGFDKLKPGDSVVVQIGELKLQERRISLGVPQDPNRDDWKGYVAQPVSSSGSFGTLGDQLKSALEKKKK